MSGNLEGDPCCVAAESLATSSPSINKEMGNVPSEQSDSKIKEWIPKFKPKVLPGEHSLKVRQKV